MSKRRSRDETRALLLATGSSMLLETGIPVKLSNLAMIDVCREAGLSTAGSAYKIWDTQDAFRADLLAHVANLTTLDPATIDAITDVTRADRDNLPPLPELLRTLTADPNALAAGGPGYDIFTTLLLAARNDPALARRIHDNDIDLFASLERLYVAIAEIYDLEWVPPFDAQLLTVTLSAMVEGIVARSRTLPELLDTVVIFPDEPDRPWTIYGACVRVIVEAFTRPRTTPTAPTPSAAPPPRPPAATPSTPRAAAPTDSPAPTRRRSLGQTRTLLLDTGARMMLDSGIAVTLGQLDLLEVCRRAGLTSVGSLYKIWESQEAFRIDLIRHLFATSLEADETPTDIKSDLAAYDEPPPSLTEIIRVTSATNFAHNSGTANTVILTVALAARHDKSLAAGLAEADQAAVATFVEIYETAREVFGLDWAPPFDARILAVALSALVQGFAIREMATPELVPVDLARQTGPDGTDRPWHLFACAVEALMMGFTRPRPDPPEGPDRPVT